MSSTAAEIEYALPSTRRKKLYQFLPISPDKRMLVVVRDPVRVVDLEIVVVTRVEERELRHGDRIE